MPPFTHARQVTIRYAPYHQPVSLHRVWKPEKAYDKERLATHRVFGPDIGIAVSPTPRRFPDTATLPSRTTEHAIITLIPKPYGEAGRSSSRGYSLHQTLQWNDYREVLAYVKDLIKQHLDLKLVISDQDPVALAKVYAAAEKRYPRFHEYADNWALNDLLKTARKYLNAAKNGAAMEDGDGDIESEDEGKSLEVNKKGKGRKLR